MKQSGTYHIYKVENNIRVISPIANAYLYFIQNDAIKLTAKTDAKGKFNFDLPLGSYIVGSASEGGIEQILANGSKFTLDASSKLDAFEKWINAPSADVDSELLKRFRELAKQSQDAADEAQKILNQMNSGSIGEGKWLKEGAYGVGGSGRIVKLDTDGFRKYLTDTSPSEHIRNDTPSIYTFPYGAGTYVRTGGTFFSLSVSHINSSMRVVGGNMSGEGLVVNDLYGTTNTVTDKNNVLHSGTSVAKDTLVVGDFGWGKDTTVVRDSEYSLNGGSFQSLGLNTPNAPPGLRHHMVLNFPWSDLNITGKVAIDNFGRNVAFYGGFGNAMSEEAWMIAYHSKNTTVDSNGNIKAASPIIKLFSDHIESNDSFKEKPTFKKLGTGVYKISNTLGLAKEGWYIETPKDKNGLPYFMVDWEQDEESQDVIIRVFKKKLDLETLDFVSGEPIDIGEEQRWIDLRFEEDHERIAEEEAESARKLEEERNLEAELLQ